ncbi:hypothetical protein M5689_013220 [Euphorbia peplus]|nr:hypothetical protein M5689_013220 [Euphorbia peplus]
MAEFQNCLEDCNLIDLGWKISEFTWFNRREGNDSIWERLDRAIVDKGWFDIFLTVTVLTLPRICSDHHPILIDTQGGCSNVCSKKRFRFEAMWLRHDTCKQTITEAWNSSMGADVQFKIVGVSNALVNWNYHTFRNITREKKG